MSSFWLIIKQQWTIEEISIFSNSSHLEWKAELSDTILKWDYPRTIAAKCGLIWFSGFREEDLNVIVYQNMTNLHNLHKSAEQKIPQKNSDYFPSYWSNFFVSVDTLQRKLCKMGCTKIQNEIETQRNETKYYETQRNETKYYEAQRNETKYTKMWNETKIY